MDILYTILSVTCRVLGWIVLVGGGLFSAVVYFIAIPMDQSLDTDFATVVVVWVLLTAFLFGLSVLLGTGSAHRGKRSLSKDADIR
jgi:hypothetical protein